MLNSNKYLLFSSVGNNSKCYKKWYNKKNRNYDIKLVYYGKKHHVQDDIKKYCDILECKKGSKYQNMVNFYDKFEMAKYDYVWLVDDDIEMIPNDISEMFDYVKNNSLDLAQPSMDPTGQNSHNINVNKENKKRDEIRYTNFIEVGCPVINKEILYNTYKTLKDINNIVTAYGVDFYWNTFFLDETKKNFGVLLKYIVRNPFPKDKNLNVREIFYLKGLYMRKYPNKKILELLKCKIINPTIL